MFAARIFEIENEDENFLGTREEFLLAIGTEAEVDEQISELFFFTLPVALSPLAEQFLSLFIFSPFWFLMQFFQVWINCDIGKLNKMNSNLVDGKVGQIQDLISGLIPMESRDETFWWFYCNMMHLT